MPGLGNSLRERFLGIYPASPATALARWKVVEAAYSGSGRHYHNLQHLAEMFDRLDAYPEELKDRNSLELSIFYHDLIYRAHRKDNELRSAQAAQKTLLEDHYPATSLVQIHEYILATKDHLLPEGSPADLAILLDLDLGILGSSPERYLAYTQDVRKEYRIFPDFLYIPGRRKALEAFLVRPRIFHTTYFRDELEVRARKNVAAEISRLG